MSDKPKREFWQFHLSTAVLTTFVIAILLWASIVRPRAFVQSEVRVYGWPAYALVLDKTLVERGGKRGGFEPGWYECYGGAFCLVALIVDTIVNFGIVGVWIFVTVSLICRREAHKP